MSNLFTEVFSELHMDEASRRLFASTDITKVSTNRSRDFLRVYLSSDHLIPKEAIRRLEQQMETELFSGSMKVCIIEQFRLSDAYDLKSLFEAYWPSILSEIHQYSPVLYGILHRAAAVVEDDGLALVFPDTMVAHEKEDEIRRIIEKIFAERCGIPPRLTINYKKEKSEESDGLDREIRAIVQRRTEAEQSMAEEAGGEGEKPADTGLNRGKGGSRGSATGVKKARKRRIPDSPDLIFGRNFEGNVIPMNQITDGMGTVIVQGRILEAESREIKGERYMFILTVSDDTDTFRLKIFCAPDIATNLEPVLKPGLCICARGAVSFDTFDKDLSIQHVTGIRKTPEFKKPRKDESPVKRVELHCHTKMSDMDGVTDVKDLIRQAAAWGQKAIAITDHGDVQAFPDALKAAKDAGPDFKVIYGVEGYLVDDTIGLVKNPHHESFDDGFVVFDLETTGLSAESCAIIEIGAVKVQGGEIVDRYSTFVNPKRPIPFHIQELTSIRDDMVKNAPKIETVLPEFLAFCEGCAMVAHNADFDMGFLEKNCRDQGYDLDKTVLDTVTLSRFLLPSLNRYKLDTVAKALQVSLEHHHRAVDDAAATAEIFLKLMKMLMARGVSDMDALDAIRDMDETYIRKLPSYHVILLAKNDIGRVNLYRLVSDSHLKYFNKRPLIPKSELDRLREGLLIGSACEAGELFQALLANRSDEEISRLVRFYDYLEIQPLGNNRFMIASDRHDIKNDDDLITLNRRIIELGQIFDKPVVATGDVHFMNPEDEVYRRIIMAGKGFKDADEQAPLYLRTTEEMLAEFTYLGEDLAREVVITNPNRIADMCERISPVRPDKCPPVIPDSDKTLREICYQKAHEIYGENLPDIVTERLERELTSIISNGFAVMYIIAQKLVWKSNEDGYLVGSRGSVGSSFVATMAGITEVNPLSPHYLCPECHYVDFDSELVKSYAGKAGCDMPDQNCPVCGHPLNKLGFDIPFETFLGFKGNKEPDIDLNFSGEYQGKAHKYTEVIFGKGQTFRAGTIGTLAQKTARGFVLKYYEEHDQVKRNCEVDRLANGCVGVRRTTGQHPGGIIVLPLGEEINSFTPVQHPANDMNTDTITTHFDYHSIEHNLLKLDILGHDDPSMIRMLQDLTGIDPLQIPLDDPKVMTLFQNTEAIGVTPEDIMGCELGALGIPEFGTDFAMQMLIDTKPQAFSDLVRIAGLSHGTDVWLGNAKDLILSGTATISTAICTRDDIMTYLISMGMEKELSFEIMEKVRKGKGLREEWEKEMRAHDVPDWYIESCNKIKYMFPKAHAVAYVMMAWRIAYCKVYYPLEYYAAFFSIRATAFDYALMCRSREEVEEQIRRIEAEIQEYKASKKEPPAKLSDTYRDIRVVQEMLARGFEFWPIDVYRAKSRRFQVIEGKLMPALNTIDGMGDKAADSVEEAAASGPFLSLDDFRDRTHVSKTVTDQMQALGILEALPESNQLSLFDF